MASVASDVSVEAPGEVGVPAITPTSPTPKFGGVLPNGKGVWLGGPPNAAYTKSVRVLWSTPLCVRSYDTTVETKTYFKRALEGCPTKFKRDDPDFPLLAFADETLRHMETHGMDTVFHMKGAAADGSGAEELFTYHAKYTRSQVDQFIAEASRPGGHFDDVWCQSSLVDSATWLLNSLDESLKSSLHPSFVSRPTGPQLWMLIVAEVQSDFLYCCSLMAKKFEKLFLSNFKGENVRD